LPAAIVLLATATCGQQHQAADESAPSAPTAVPSTSTPLPSVSTSPHQPKPPASDRPVDRPPTPTTLQLGDRGTPVVALQQRLVDLHYWLGDVDGVFGQATQQAVYALQGAAGLSRDGVVGPDTSAALTRGLQPTVRATPGDGAEIDIGRGLLVVIRHGTVGAILHVSTGGGYLYTDDDGVTSRAITPVGAYRIERRRDGWVQAPLGWLWRPEYFVGGYAIHGYADVPAYPASHGCVRVGIPAMNWLWDAEMVPVGSPLLIY
jgi:peptidoglycan hydrolase-like protein with peptidoglycan-binding domain